MDKTMGPDGQGGSALTRQDGRFITAYHDNGYRHIYDTSNAEVRQLWDSYDDITAFEDFIDLPTRRKMLEARLDGYSTSWATNSIDLDELLETQQDIYFIFGPQDEVRKYFFRWLEEVVEEAPSVSGDDSYYDYYPDNFYFADQMAQWLGAEEEVANAKRKIYDLGLYHDEDAVNHGLPLDDHDIHPFIPGTMMKKAAHRS